MAGKAFLGWPVLRQLTGKDPLGRGPPCAPRTPRRSPPAPSPPTGSPAASAPTAPSGCGQKVFVKDEKVVQIEGDPDSPISRGRLCPKGSASKNLVTSPLRQTKVRYRRPFGTEWEDLDLDVAMEMIADRVVKARNDSLAGHRREGPQGPAHPGHRQPRRSDPRQRGELPHQEAVHGDGRDPDREPGAYLTLRHRPRSGDQLRARRRHAGSSRTSPTLTASSSRARTWPRPTRWASSG